MTPTILVTGGAACTTAVYADPCLAERNLNWKARLELKQMCKDAHCWKSKNPKGYLWKRALHAKALIPFR